jgi:hypothetical protein
VEEVGDGQLTSPLFNQGHFEAKGTSFGEILIAEMLRQSQVKASLRQGRPLRRRCCRTISESSGHPFRVPSFVQDSRDLGEHDQISLEAIQHCNDVPLSFQK